MNMDHKSFYKLVVELRNKQKEYFLLMYPENDDLALMRGIISDSQTTMNVVNTSTNKTVGTFVRRD